MSRFQPGKSGNPGGRPKTKPFKEALMLLMNREVTIPSDSEVAYLPRAKNQTALMESAYQLMKNVFKGDQSAINTLIERLDGKVAQPIKGGDDPDDNPIRIEGEMSLKELARCTGFLLLSAAEPPKN